MTKAFHRRWQKTLVAAGAFGAAAMAGTGSAVACEDTSTVYVGSVCTVGGSWCPEGYYEAAGQMLSPSQEQVLFAVIGCQYGGNCTTSFMLPDLRQRMPVAVGSQAATEVRPGEMIGRPEVVLTENNLPAHSHAATVDFSGGATVRAFDGKGNDPAPSSANSHLQTVAVNAFTDNDAARAYGSGTGTGSPVQLAGVDLSISGSSKVNPSGQSGRVNIQDPILGVTACIAYQGLYPPRD